MDNRYTSPAEGEVMGTTPTETVAISFATNPLGTFIAAMTVLKETEGERDRLIEERTQACAELFRAQERVRKLEDLLAPFAGLNRPSEGEYEEIYDAVFLEATRIATKRREGK